MINLPPHEELEYERKRFLQSLHDQIQASTKGWFVLFFLVLVLAWPLGFILAKAFTSAFIATNPRLVVNEHPHAAQDLQITKTEIIPVTRGIFSAYAQIVNPNPTLSAREVVYHFVLYDSADRELTSVGGTSYIIAGESKFLVEPSIATGSASPDNVKLTLDEVRWTAFPARSDLHFEVLQKNSGTTAEGNFFVEGLVKNPETFGTKQINVQVVVFDRTNTRIVAVNSTIMNDLKPQESRYFRVTWPKKYTDIGQVQVTPLVNLLDPGLILERSGVIPVR